MSLENLQSIPTYNKPRGRRESVARAIRNDVLHSLCEMQDKDIANRETGYSGIDFRWNTLGSCDVEEILYDDTMFREPRRGEEPTLYVPFLVINSITGQRSTLHYGLVKI